MSEPRKYTRTIEGTFIQLDPQSTPWPEGIDEGLYLDGVRQFGCMTLRGYYAIDPGDYIELDDTGSAIAVIPKDEFEGMGWREKGDGPKVHVKSMQDRPPLVLEDHPTESTEEEIDVNKLGGTF